MRTETPIDPPLTITERSGQTFTLTSVGQLIECIRRRDSGEFNWRDVRRAAFVAAAIPSLENVQALRKAAAQAFELDPKPQSVAGEGAEPLRHQAQFRSSSLAGAATTNDRSVHSLSDRGR